MDFTPADYAKIIGITSSPDGFTTSLPSQEQIRKMAELEQRVHDKTTRLSGRFYDEFSSQYLPSFLRAYFNTPWDLKSDFHNFLSLSVISTLSGIAFARFVRENLDEVAGFLVVHLSRMDTLFNEYFLSLDRIPVDRNKALDAQDAVYRCLGIFAHISDAYLINRHHLKPTSTSFQPPEEILEPVKYWLHNAKQILKTTFVKYEHAPDFPVRMTYNGLEKFIKVLETGSLDFPEDCRGIYNCCGGNATSLQFTQEQHIRLASRDSTSCAQIVELFATAVEIIKNFDGRSTSSSA